MIETKKVNKSNKFEKEFNFFYLHTNSIALSAGLEQSLQVNCSTAYTLRSLYYVSLNTLDNANLVRKYFRVLASPWMPLKTA
jgi:hypothetical protein